MRLTGGQLGIASLGVAAAMVVVLQPMFKGGPVGQLSAPNGQEVLRAHAASESIQHPRMTEEFRLDMSCDEVSDFAGIELRHLQGPPSQANETICFVEGTQPQQLPDPDGLDPLWVHVMYVPDSLDLDIVSFSEALDLGALDVQLSATTSEARPVTNGDSNAESGGYAPIEIGSRQGVVQRTAPNRVWVSWQEDTSAGTRRGPFLDVSMMGDYSPDQMHEFASRLAYGTPANERDPMTNQPPPSRGGQRPDGATASEAATES